MTNFEKIKNMSVEEMAEWLQNTLKECDVCIYGEHNTCPCTCIYGITEWLESEAENDR